MRQYSVLVQGVSRIRVLSLSEDGPLLLGSVVRLFDQGSIADAEVGSRRPQRRAGVFCRLMCVLCFAVHGRCFSCSGAVSAALGLSRLL